MQSQFNKYATADLRQVPKLRILLKIAKISSGPIFKGVWKIQSGLENSKVSWVQYKIQAVQKIQLRPKYEQIKKWPKKFEKWPKYSTKFQVAQKIQLRRKSKSIGLVNAP